MMEDYFRNDSLLFLKLYTLCDSNMVYNLAHQILIFHFQMKTHRFDTEAIKQVLPPDWDKIFTYELLGSIIQFADFTQIEFGDIVKTIGEFPKDKNLQGLKRHYENYIKNTNNDRLKPVTFLYREKKQIVTETHGNDVLGTHCQSIGLTLESIEEKISSPKISNDKLTNMILHEMKCKDLQNKKIASI